MHATTIVENTLHGLRKQGALERYFHVFQAKMKTNFATHLTRPVIAWMRVDSVLAGERPSDIRVTVAREPRLSRHVARLFNPSSALSLRQPITPLPPMAFVAGSSPSPTDAAVAVPAFSTDTDAGGKLNVFAAGESGVFSYVRWGLEAGGGRPLGSDGLQTFGGVLALARYVKIEAVPSGDVGAIVINEV